MKKQKDLLEGRTKEWDTNDWQGRSKEQIDANYKVMGLSGLVFIAGFLLYGLYSLITYVLG